MPLDGTIVEVLGDEFSKVVQWLHVGVILSKKIGEEKKEITIDGGGVFPMVKSGIPAKTKNESRHLVSNLWNDGWREGWSRRARARVGIRGATSS
ncbi:hypothetical protein [Pedosphaera parvula]|uniref:Uncharacterized protein n=1 Tax=Pedosphaera parvula (strain Ellin514) TaxID=320771 RepID=B9XJC5_PEDPL|nr:hypothetical protein [Pedosphaera parvula]EEF59986.1 hypothetical protein Cflav_PD3045 [Pedosphaera parvula Ellin514]